MIKNQEKMIKLLTVLFPESTIYLYGSRARGDYHERSDVDVAIDNAGQRIDYLDLAQAANIVEALNIPQEVNLVDFNALPGQMRQIILNEGLVWKK